MSEDALEAGGLQIIESILSEADTRASRILESAENAANAVRDNARKDGERARDEVSAKTRERCERTRTQELATARIEAKRLLLAARENVAEHVLKQVKAKLEAIRSSPDAYAQSLWNLAAEAVAAIGLPEVVLRISKTDAGFLGDSFAGLLAADSRVSAAGVSKVGLQLEEYDLGGGCTAQSPDGRVVYDNTYRTRMQRKRRELRAMIVRDAMTGHG